MITSVGVCLVYIAACSAAGASLLTVIGVGREQWRNFSAAAFLATTLLVGEGLLASIWLVLGLAGEFSLPLVVGLIVLFLLLGAAVVRREIVDTFRRLWIQVWNHLSGLQISVGFLAVLTLFVLVLLGVFNAILPVRFGAGDGIFFYMALPKVMAESGRLALIGGHEYTHGVSGFIGEMHHAALLKLAGEQAALLFVWVTTISMIAILVSMCGLLGVGRMGKWVAVVMVLSSTSVTFYLIDGKVDLFAVAMGIAALYWAVQVQRSKALVPVVILVGLLTGFSVVAKATYVLAVGLPVVAILYFNVRYSRSLFFLCLVFFVSALLPVVPQAIKNFVFFGEPFAPFLFLESDIGAVYRSQGSWHAPKSVWLILMSYPLALAYGDYAFQYGNISGLFIALGPLVLLVPVREWRQNKNLMSFTFVIIIAVTVSALAQVSYFAPRFLLPALLALIPAIAFASEYVFQTSNSHMWFRGVMIACMCIALIGYSTLEQDFKRTVRYKIHHSGICDLEGFPLPECHDMLALNKLADRGERINITWNDYKYWLRSDLIQCLATEYEQGLSWDEWYDRGFRYIENAGIPLDLTDVPVWMQVSNVYSRQATGLSQPVQIYELYSRDSKRSPSYACQQTDEGEWQVVKSG
ncbi:MAG: hypothetical protein MK000_02415 [Anaerolineales bacterium]|nr:hypothetical protein [Anaerolineales bacterium]